MISARGANASRGRHWRRRVDKPHHCCTGWKWHGKGGEQEEGDRIASTVDRPGQRVPRYWRYTSLRRELPERGLSLSLTAVINELWNSRGIIHWFLVLANFWSQTRPVWYLFFYQFHSIRHELKRFLFISPISRSYRLYEALGLTLSRSLLIILFKEIE